MLIDVLAASLLLGLVQTATSAQSSASPAPVAQSAAAPNLADSPTPTDPKELLEVGRKVNGLSGPDVQPWHLKASFEIFDDDGKSKDTGDFEEWWVSEKQYKLSYQSKAFSQVEYGTESGVLRSGDPKWLGGPLSLIRQQFAQPLPAQGEMSWAKPEASERILSGVKLRCVAMTSNFQAPANAPPPIVPTYCFTADKPVLRIASTFSQVAFNRILLFNGHYLGGDIEATNHGKDYLRLHLDLIEPLKPSSVDFQPPSDAVAPPPRRINVSGGVAAGNILTKVQPDYPAGALANRIQGTVGLQAIISRTGHITELRAISGPRELQGAAIDAVRKWTYKPYLLNGEPVEVQTMINVVFSLSSR